MSLPRTPSPKVQCARRPHRNHCAPTIPRRMQRGRGGSMSRGAPSPKPGRWPSSTPEGERPDRSRSRVRVVHGQHRFFVYDPTHKELRLPPEGSGSQRATLTVTSHSCRHPMDRGCTVWSDSLTVITFLAEARFVRRAPPEEEMRLTDDVPERHCPSRLKLAPILTWANALIASPR